MSILVEMLVCIHIMSIRIVMSIRMDFLSKSKHNIVRYGHNVDTCGDVGMYTHNVNTYCYVGLLFDTYGMSE